MDITFEELFNSFKILNELEKKQAIIDFLKNDIIALQTINKDINNNLDSPDISAITKEPIEDHLDIIYQLLHIMTEQVEMFSEKVATDFYD